MFPDHLGKPDRHRLSILDRHWLTPSRRDTNCAAPSEANVRQQPIAAPTYPNHEVVLAGKSTYLFWHVKVDPRQTNNPQVHARRELSLLLARLISSPSLPHTLELKYACATPQKPSRRRNKACSPNHT